VDPEGYVDVYRVPKYAYYLWQANYYKKLMVFIQPHYWRSQYTGQKKDIVVTSNCYKVELKVNGVSLGFQFPNAANFHSVTFKDVTVEEGTLAAIATYNGQLVSTQVVMAGAPAKITLEGSHKKITADRGSLAILTADIVDSKGNHVYGATNTIKWTLTGPATLVGPSGYESDISKQNEMEGVWYMDMPVSNIIRSTGKPDKIKITVSASGLASGSFDIEAEEKPVDNSVIAEPVLADKERKPVDRIAPDIEIKYDIPHEIKPTNDEFIFNQSDKQGFAMEIRDYILRNNPYLDSATLELKVLVDLFATQLLNNNGHMMADDYNYNVDHYNNCRLISGYLNIPKIPSQYKEGLKKYFVNSIILQGNEKNAGEVLNWLNWIPSGGTVVIFSDKGNIETFKGATVISKSDLASLISVVYPVFVNFSEEGKERALIFISKMNPYIHVTSIREQSSEGDKEKITKVSYTAEKGQPILIPLLKFISE
jgi:hypothetical protein